MRGRAKKLEGTDARNLVLFAEALEQTLSPNSAKTYVNAVRRALLHNPEDPAAFLFRKGRQLAASSRHTYLAAIRRWAEFTEDSDLRAKLTSPELRQAFKSALRTEHVHRQRQSVQPFSPAEEARIQAVLDRWRDDPEQPCWLWPALSMMFSLGLRAGVDLAWLTRRDAEAALRDGTQLIIVTKGSKERSLPAVLVLEELRTLIDLPQRWKVLADLIVTREPSGGRLIPNAYERLRLAVKLLAREAGIPEQEMHTHRFRHAAANRLYEATHDLKKVQQFLGHATLATTLGYLKKNRTAEIGQDLLAAMRRRSEEE